MPAQRQTPRPAKREVKIADAAQEREQKSKKGKKQNQDQNQNQNQNQSPTQLAQQKPLPHPPAGGPSTTFRGVPSRHASTFPSVVCAISVIASRVKKAWCAVTITLGNINSRASTSSCNGRFE